MYTDFPYGQTRHLPPIPVEAGQLTYKADIPDLVPGGKYYVAVQAWQNVSGVTAGSALQSMNATTSEACNFFLEINAVIKYSG